MLPCLQDGSSPSPGARWLVSPIKSWECSFVCRGRSLWSLDSPTGHPDLNAQTQPIHSQSAWPRRALWPPQTKSPLSC